MSKIPQDLLYTEDDEWLRVEGGEATIGITDYAQDSLSDIVYLEFPEEGDAFAAGESFGVVESVKAAAELYMPVSSEVLAVNEGLLESPELVNDDPYGEGWMVKIAIHDQKELENLLSPDAYQQSVIERG